MQVIILSAFALVLWLTPTYQPYLAVSSGGLTILLALVHPVATLVAARAVARLAVSRLRHGSAQAEHGQRTLARGTVGVHCVAIGGLLGMVFVTDWVPAVRQTWILSRVYGLDDLCVLAPFLVSLLMLWVGIYPADRAIRHLSMEARMWEAKPTHPVWTLRRFLLFNLRHHLLIVMVPMVLILIAFDATRAQDAWLRDKTGIFWAADGLLGIIAGVIFLFLPTLLVWIWSTARLSDGALRARLQLLCNRIELRYKQILVWHSDGQVINAAVTGLLAPVRYVMLSDGLLETMDHEKIEAVFGHEAGHVKHHHIFFFLLFAVLSMFTAGGVVLLVARYGLIESTQAQQTLILVCLALMWGFGFGWVSRRFERQADLFGVRCVTHAVTVCAGECRVHGTGANPDAESSAICATAAARFCEALSQIAELNCIPAEARSWRHSSIASRIAQLHRFARDPQAVADFDRKLTIIKITILITTAIATGIAAGIYWPW